MHIKGDLVASGIAAIADDLNVAFLLDGRVGVGGCFVPELDLDDVGFQVIQRQVPSIMACSFSNSGSFFSA